MEDFFTAIGGGILMILVFALHCVLATIPIMIGFMILRWLVG
jgi:hypothetical protein